MNTILYDDSSWETLLPLTFTRPVSEIRIGILTIAEKWKYYFNEISGNHTKDYLLPKFGFSANDNNLLINGSILPDFELAEAIKKLKKNEVLVKDSKSIALIAGKNELKDFNPLEFNNYVKNEYSGNIDSIDRPWHIFTKNGKEIRNDFSLITSGRKSAALSSTNRVLCPENIFVEEGVKAEFVTINASTGPVYLGKNSEIMENSVIRGPFALCEGSTVKMAAKIYGPTTIGPYSKIGGEVNNSVLFANSNKGHDGFLGNSVLGEWCNIGADTNNSNLKNNYAEVKLWSYQDEKFINTGLQFCGLIMGDHSKCGINTMFNTGTVVGVNANVFGTGFPRSFIPSFSWGGPQGFTVYSLQKAFETAEIVMSRRNIALNETDKEIMRNVYNMTSKYRR
jgi:UDP-N-acetylglucosamine diphosphorylase/glucosamine-1-phosphate N-acetyltransferase